MIYKKHIIYWSKSTKSKEKNPDELKLQSCSELSRRIARNAKSPRLRRWKLRYRMKDWNHGYSNLNLKVFQQYCRTQFYWLSRGNLRCGLLAFRHLIRHGVSPIREPNQKIIPQGRKSSKQPRPASFFLYLKPSSFVCCVYSKTCSFVRANCHSSPSPIFVFLETFSSIVICIEQNLATFRWSFHLSDKDA